MFHCFKIKSKQIDFTIALTTFLKNGCTRFWKAIILLFQGDIFSISHITSFNTNHNTNSSSYSILQQAVDFCQWCFLITAPEREEYFFFTPSVSPQSVSLFNLRSVQSTKGGKICAKFTTYLIIASYFLLCWSF